MKPMRTFTAVAVAGAVLLGTTANAALLTDLLVPGATLQQGDKIFGDFTWEGPSGPAGFTISGIGSGVGSDYYGIQIQGPMDNIGVGASDWALTYSVSIDPLTANGRLISDVHQKVNLSSQSLTTIADISEDVSLAPGGSPVAHSTVGKLFGSLDHVDDPLNPSTWELFDALVLPNPVSKVWVTKDILLRGTAEGDYIAATLIEQRFSQVPEPTTMIAGLLLLLPFGASTMRLLRRKAQ